MRAVFMGSPEFALPSLEALAAHYRVVGVVTQPDRPAGRGRRLRPPAVRPAAPPPALPVRPPPPPAGAPPARPGPRPGPAPRRRASPSGGGPGASTRAPFWRNAQSPSLPTI